MDLPDSYAACRLLRHAWDKSPNDPFRKPPFGERIVLRCIRCTTIRSDLVSRVNGELLARKYLYPDDYQMTADDRPTTEELRVWGLDWGKK